MVIKMKYEVVCTKNYLDIGLLIEKNDKLKPKRVLARASAYSSDPEPEYGGVETLTWIHTSVFLSKDEWIKITYDKSTDQILSELGISKKPIETLQNNGYKFCPLMVRGENMHVNGYCIGESCSWWCKWANDCSIPLLAGMFADSTVCQSVFENIEDRK